MSLPRLNGKYVDYESPEWQEHLAEEESYERNKKRKKIFKATLLIGLIVTGLLLVPMIIFGLESVPVNHVGLKYNWITQNLSEQPTEAGMYFIGIDHNFINFPTTIIEISFFESGSDDAVSPLDSRSSDGLLINIQVAFQYRLDQLNVYTLYKTYGNNYHDVFSGQARSTLRDVASNWKAIEFFYNRSAITTDMQHTLYEVLLPMFAEVVFFQLREFDLPDAFEASIEAVQVAQQDSEAAKYEQQAAIIRAETTIIQAQALANITIIEAEASAEAFLINMEAQAKALNITLRAEQLAYYGIAQQLNLTSTELLAYLWIKAIMEHDESLIIIGTNTPDLILEDLWTNSTTTGG